jgi:hypothetical protein
LEKLGSRGKVGRVEKLESHLHFSHLVDSVATDY